MDFLKEILGDELFATVSEKINAYNGNEKNKDKQIKLTNLTDGGYVSKEKYTSLETENNSKISELEKANTLIAELKKSMKSDEGIQNKISEYETQVANLNDELAKTKLESAIKVSLLEAKANDIDYLTFKLKEQGDALELDENGKIKGWNDKISALKTKFPNQFEGSGNKKINEHKLENGDDEHKMTKSELMKKSYNERAEFYKENPEEFKEIMKGD